MTEPLPSVPGVTLHDVLGRGGSGVVYSGTDDATGHRVAVKIIDPTKDETARRATGFGTGSDALVQLYRVGKVDGSSCIVMELCPGGTLAAQVAARGSLDLPEIVSILLGLAQGIRALHAKDLVHADISPSNVLFTALGRPVLGDLEAIGRVGEPLPDEVTPRYADDAAERLTPGFDIHALGAVGWFMLTGEAPGPATTRLPLPVLRTDTPPALAELIVACLAPPARRPSLDDVVARLHGLGIDPEPVRLQPVGPATDRTHVITARRRRTGAVAAASRAARQTAQENLRQETRRERRRRMARVGAGVAAALAVLVGVRVVTEPDSSAAVVPQSTVTPTASASVSDPVAALTTLNLRRQKALAALDMAALGAVDAPSSPALKHDQQLIRGLRSKGVRPDGLKVEVLWTTRRDLTATSATVLLSSVVMPYRQVRIADGSVAAQVPRGKVITTVVRLRLCKGQWRVFQVTPD